MKLIFILILFLSYVLGQHHIFSKAIFSLDHVNILKEKFTDSTTNNPWCL